MSNICKNKNEPRFKPLSEIRERLYKQISWNCTTHATEIFRTTISNFMQEVAASYFTYAGVDQRWGQVASPTSELGAGASHIT